MEFFFIIKLQNTCHKTRFFRQGMMWRNNQDIEYMYIMCSSVRLRRDNSLSSSLRRNRLKYSLHICAFAVYCKDISANSKIFKQTCSYLFVYSYLCTISINSYFI